MKVAIYARISTKDKNQNLDTQLFPLREYVATKKLELVREYCDVASARDLRGRTAWRKLLDDARGGQFEIVLVLRLDRMARSVKDLYGTLTEWDNIGVSFLSIKENFETGTSTGRLLMHFMAALAEFELDIIRDRINDGLARARKEGKRLGRPPGSKDKTRRKRSGYRMRHAIEARGKGQ